MKTSEALRKTIERNPSHLGSKRKFPASGSPSASLASIGSIGGSIGNDPPDCSVLIATSPVSCDPSHDRATANDLAVCRGASERMTSRNQELRQEDFLMARADQNNLHHSGF